MKQNIWRSTWSAITIYVDINTGEKITEQEAKQKYITIKITKYAKRSKYGTGGIIEYTKQCIRNPQRELPFNNP